MYSIFLFGNKLRGFAEKLLEKGFRARFFRSPSALIKNAHKADIIVIDSTEGTHSKELARCTRDTPKVLVSPNGAQPRIGSWLREPFAYPIVSPSAPELASFVSRVLKETGRIRENKSLAEQLSAARDETDFLERMSRVLMTSNSPSEIYSTILRRIKKVTSADGWAYHMTDEDTGELYCKSSSGIAKGCTHSMPARGVAIKGKPVRISGKSRRGAAAGKHKKTPGPYLGAPVIADSQVLGVIELYKGPGGLDFTRSHTDLLEKLAGLAAHAVEKIDLQQRLEELVITDDLTQLFNSRYLNRSLETEIQRSSRYGMSVSLIFIDLDHFKDVNDVHGHLVGSKLLAEIGQLLMSQLRSLDIVARYGGDEFVIVLPQTELNNAMLISERMRKDIEESVFLRKEGINMRITASFGVASYPETANSKDALIRIADESMYNVKKSTRNGVYAII
jgi:diguanylate cyclase (GGDEF)-like protein